MILNYFDLNCPAKMPSAGYLRHVRFPALQSPYSDTNTNPLSDAFDHVASQWPPASCDQTIYAHNGCWYSKISPLESTKMLKTASDQRGHLDLLVKRYPNGKASTHLHSMAPGQTLLFMAAIKGYQWRQNAHKHIVLIAGGSGITPIYQLLQDIMLNPEDTTAVTLVFGVNNDEDVLFEAQFAQWAKLYPGRFKVVYAITNPTPGSPYRKGRITRELLQEVIAGPGSRVTMAFVSGPAAMEKALVGNGILRELGFQRGQIHKF